MILIDPPSVPARGRWWSHLVSDTSYEELHAFAERLGVPRVAFDRDHYDIPADAYEAALAAGAVAVSPKELVARLARAGLRRSKYAVRPTRLRPGDTVRVVAPSGPAHPERVAAGVEVLESWGLRAQVAEGVGGEGPMCYLAASDEQRARDLQQAWCDPEVKAVWATRGGYGAQRVLDLLDVAMMAGAGPRLLVGYSDVTALHRAVGTRLGVASLHGPGVAALGELTDLARERVRSVVMDGVATELPGRWLVPAQAPVTGPLVGGNLAIVAGTVGTPEAGSARGAIALFEDVNEPPYKIDRLLTQLLRSGWLRGVRAVVCGDFTGCGEPGVVEEVLRDRLGDLGVPVLVGLPIGHGEENAPVLLGARAELRVDGSVRIGGLR